MEVSSINMIIYLFIIMLILVFLGVPIVYSIGISSTIILLFQGNNSLALLSSRMFKGIDSFTLSASGRINKKAYFFC